MVPTCAAVLMYVIGLIVASILGIIAGGLTSLALRQHWGLKAALIDGVLALIVAVTAAYVVSAIDNARGVLESRVGLVLAIAAASVVVSHLLRLAVRSSN